MAATAEKKECMYDTINDLFEKVQGLQAEDQEQHRLQYNAATRELYSILTDHREGDHYLSDDEHELAQEAMDRVNEIKSKMRALNTKARQGDREVIGDEIPAELQKEFDRAYRIISLMGANPYKQKLAREAILDAGCKIVRGKRVDMVIPTTHPAKVALWEAYRKQALENDLEEAGILEAKKEAGTLVEQEVRRLDMLINQIIPKLRADLGQ